MLKDGPSTQSQGQRSNGSAVRAHNDTVLTDRLTDYTKSYNRSLYFSKPLFDKIMKTPACRTSRELMGYKTPKITLTLTL